MEVEVKNNLKDLREAYAKDFHLASQQMATQMINQVTTCPHFRGGGVCDECKRAATILKTISVCFSVMADAIQADKIDEFRRVLADFGRDYVADFPFESAIFGTVNSADEFPEIITE